MTQRITPMLWFDHEAEDAARFDTSIFANSQIASIFRSGAAAPGAEAPVMVVDFEIDGQEFTALNGGPRFKFAEAISLVVNCEDQQEVDYYWDRLLDGGTTQQCGWLKDRYGLSWQVVPRAAIEMLTSADRVREEKP